jgi:hypothetical protein
MKTLIITVGTRQIGWHCNDGIVRSLGADGDRGHPKHIDELYAELGLERNYHGDKAEPQFAWSVRHLGEQFYEWCEVHEDFSAVELLLDGQLLGQEIKAGVSQIILWGTDQPETVPWNFRRADTVWLARLMAGKIRKTWPGVEVDVWNPNVAANDVVAIRQEIEGFLLEYVREAIGQVNDGLTLLIETKGSAPAIANTLEICAAALTRQYSVVQVTPVEPTSLFQAVEAGIQANQSEKYSTTSIGEFFWPMERERIRSAWERGDFGEAKVWLEAHRDRYDALYKLADILALASNGELEKALKQLRDGWVRSKAVGKLVTEAQCQVWQQRLGELLPISETQDSNVQRVWETMLFLELSLARETYTSGFMLFAQLVERLLYAQAKAEDWIGKGYIEVNPSFKGNPLNYNPGFGGLLRGWCKSNGKSEISNDFKLLDTISKKRNEIVHNGLSINISDMRSLWTTLGLPVSASSDSTEMMVLMQEILEKIAKGRWAVKDVLLLRSLYEWGLEKLRAVT